MAQPIMIYYEHPEWFTPLFAELDRRGGAEPEATAFVWSRDRIIDDFATSGPCLKSTAASGECTSATQRVVGGPPDQIA